jgi:lipoprotein-anchoring transpeptidase ErfK/SrfK
MGLRRIRYPLVAVGAALGIMLAGCVTGSGHPSAPPQNAASPIATSRPPQTAAAHQTSPRTSSGTDSLVATVLGDQVEVYQSPESTHPVLRLPNPWLLNGQASTPVPQVFLVLATRPDGWTEVLLPVRPNGSIGWLGPGSARLLDDPYRIVVVVHLHRLTVYRSSSAIYSGRVATGAPATPTPVGRFYLRVLLQSLDPRSVYGPYAYGLSAHSDALTTFDGSDAEIGIHGNNDAAVLGQAVTHGCIRMDNAEITRLATILPLGTSVQIEA